MNPQHSVFSDSASIPSLALWCFCLQHSSFQPEGQNTFVGRMTLSLSHLRPSKNTDIYIVIHHPNKSTVMKQPQKQSYGQRTPQHDRMYEVVIALGMLRTVALAQVHVLGTVLLLLPSRTYNHYHSDEQAALCKLVLHRNSHLVFQYLSRAQSPVGNASLWAGPTWSSKFPLALSHNELLFTDLNFYCLCIKFSSLTTPH